MNKKHVQYVREEIAKRLADYRSKRIHFMRGVGALTPSDPLADVFTESDLDTLVYLETRAMLLQDLVEPGLELIALLELVKARALTLLTAEAANVRANIWAQAKVEAYTKVLSDVEFWLSLLKSAQK